jgi:hypothetical protein
MELIGRPDLGNDPALAHNDGRVAQVERIDAAIGEWSARHDLDAVLAALNDNLCRCRSVPSFVDDAPPCHVADLRVSGRVEVGSAPLFFRDYTAASGGRVSGVLRAWLRPPPGGHLQQHDTSGEDVCRGTFLLLVVGHLGRCIQWSASRGRRAPSRCKPL